jgi:hypothetical protein
MKVRSLRPRALTFALVALVTIFLSFLVFGLTPAHAEGTQPASPVLLTQLTPQMVAGLVGVIIPLLVSLLARANANAVLKVWLNIVLTGAAGAASALVVSDPASGQVSFGWVPFLTAWLFAFISSSVTYLGAVQHLPINDLLLSIGGIFGQKSIPGLTDDAAALATVTDADGVTTPAQDDGAITGEDFPLPDVPADQLDPAVDGTDQ